MNNFFSFYSFFVLFHQPVDPLAKANFVWKLNNLSRLSCIKPPDLKALSTINVRI